MVRLSTIYDETIKKRVYLVRGDERYAKSTTTIFSVADGYESTSALGFTKSLTVNVLRDSGASKIVLYDNDEVIYMTDWSDSQASALTFDSPLLSWNTEHNLVAKYMGNSQCSPSSSSYTIAPIVNPELYETSVEFTSITRDIYPNTEYTVTVTITCEELDVDGDSIYFSIDGTEIGDAEISDDVATFTYSTNKTGLLTFSAEYKGNDNYESSSVETTISSGLIATITSIPTATELNSTATITGTVSHYGDVTGNINSAIYYIRAYANGEMTTLGVGSLNSDGSISKSVTFDKAYDYVKLDIEKNNKHYFSDEIPIRIYNITGITWSGNSIVANGYSNTITGTLVANGGTVDNVPIIIAKNGSFFKEIYTDDTGNFSLEIWGTGSGDNTLTASIITDTNPTYITSDFEYEDVMEYWSKKDGIFNLQWETINVRVLELSNGFKIEPINSKQVGSLRLWNTTDEFVVEYDQITGSGYKSRIRIGRVIYDGNVSWTGKHIKYIRQNGIGSLYINNVRVKQASEDAFYPFGFDVNVWQDKEPSWITIDNFRLKPLPIPEEMD